MTELTDDFLNQWGHDLRGLCWHESNGVGTLRDGGYYCIKCGDSNELAPFPAEWNANGNRDYCQDLNAARLVELAVIEAKGEHYFGGFFLEEVCDEGGMHYNPNLDNKHAARMAVASALQRMTAAYRAMENPNE